MGVATFLGLAAVEGGCRVLERWLPPGPVEARSAVGFQQLPDTPLLRPIEGFPGWLRPAPGLIDDSSLVIPPKEDGELRIVTLGGSAVGGWAVARRATFSAVMGQAMGADGGDVRVINLGRIGYASAQMAWLFEEMAAELEPDLVLVVMGNNERHDLAVEVAREGRAEPVLRRRELFRLSALARRLRPERPIHGDPDGRAGVGSDDPPTHPPDLAEIDAYAHARWRRSLRRIAAMAEVVGAPVLVGTVAANHRYRPAKHEWNFLEGDAWALDEVRSAYFRWRYGDEQALDSLTVDPLRGPSRDADYPCADADRAWYAGEPTQAAQAYAACFADAGLYRADDAMNAVIRDEAQALGLRVADVETALHQRAEHGVPDYDVFYDYCHYTPRGNVFVGHLLAAEASALLGRRPPALDPAAAEARHVRLWTQLPYDHVRFASWLGVSADVPALAALRYGEGTIEHDLGPDGSALALAFAGNRLHDRGSVAELDWLEAAASSWCRALGSPLKPIPGEPPGDLVMDPLLAIELQSNLESLLRGPAGNHLRDLAGPDAVEACVAGRDPWHRDALPKVEDI